MKLKDLEVGDKVFIREDLGHGACYGSYMYINAMGSGIKQIQYIYRDEGFSVVCGKGARYTSEMVDWEKTEKINCNKEDNIPSGELIEKEIRELDNHIKIGLIEDGKYLNIFVNDENPYVRKEVAKQRYGLDKLVNDESWYVREVVAEQGYGLDKLIHDEDEVVRDTANEKLEELIYKVKKIDDKVYNPLHYSGGGKHNIECYEAIEYILGKLENVPDKYYGHVSNIVKYIWRCNDKNGYEDLDKTSVYLDFMFRKED